MKIIIALGNREDTGGPTKYAENLAREFSKRGHNVAFISYGKFLRSLPSGARHLCYALKLLPAAARADAMLAFDTLTVGAPAALVSIVTRTPLIIRVGGDFLWEQYVERSGDLVKLSRFYQETKPRWTRKEKRIFSLTAWAVAHADRLVFNADFLRQLWRQAYSLDLSHASIVENLYPPRKAGEKPTAPVFVSAGRNIKLKNEALFRRVFESLKQKYPDVTLDTASLPAAEHQKRVAQCYAVVLASVSDVSPNAIIDAVAYGKPFICTQDTGLIERLHDTGLFVDTQNEEVLRQAVETLLKSEEYERIAARVRAFSFVRTWEQVADDFLSVIHNTCAS
ncbi:MAG: glycosyltransferase family 4 protein [Patescibacteria group bacterium]|nr:glycosyltransferase family 4 protein [Patescibacteria group bacterium]